MKFGMKGSYESSIGNLDLSPDFYGSIVKYLGTGETTDKGYVIAGSTECEQELDGGETGGLIYNGNFSYKNNASYNAAMQCFVFSGNGTAKTNVFGGAWAAVGDLAPATIAIGRAEAKRISFIRRFRMKDGTIRTNPGVGNPDIKEQIGQPDETVQVIRFRREGREEIVAVNFGTHPDTIGGDAISADWPGFARRCVEKSLDGVRCILFNGALGDVNHVCVDPRPGEREGLKRDFDDVDRGYEHAKHMGRVVAGAVMSVYGKCAPVEPGAVTYAVKDVVVPSNRPKPEELPLARKYSDLHASGKDDEIPFKGMELTTVVAEAGRMLRLENGPDTFSMPLSSVSVGGAIRFVGIPGEPFTEIGRRIKDESPAAMTFVTCITNGYYGYFPTAGAYQEGGYEARSSIFGPTVAQDLVSAAAGILV